MAKRKRRNINEIELMDTPGVVGNRLFKIRFVAGFGGEDDQGRWAEHIGVSEKSYSHWETGHVMIPLEYAVRLIEDHMKGASLDYIYRGDLDFVVPRLSRELKAAPERPPTKRGRRRRT